MAANRQQGTYLGVFLLGFTLLPAGLVVRPNHPGIGIAVAVVGLGLIIQAFLGTHRIKHLEFTNQG
ncbi:MAG TPA: hypothetical protein VMS96_12145 [Terriglobales bacterium]|nr:hypothetical protein [Terriglobales bacterium]